GAKEAQFNGLNAVLGRAARIAGILAGKAEYIAAAEAGTTNEWTQLYGEAVTLRAFCYYELVRHFGDVPYGYENTPVTEYALTSRFDIMDALIADLKRVEPLMYKVGEADITAERMSRSFANALCGEIALHAGGWQTIRTDVSGLYGDVQFETKGTEANGCVYARRTDYLDYMRTAEQYLGAAINNHNGTVRLLTEDTRSYANNPFQFHFHHINNWTVSPESFFEVGNRQSTGNSEYPYSMGRPCPGANNNAAPVNVFGAIRIIPSFYYSAYEDDDKRRDASMVITGSTGRGQELLLTLAPGNRANGGISINKWDDNRSENPYLVARRTSGMNYGVLRMADAMLMLAEAKAYTGDSQGAMSLVNQVRARAFGNNSHDISGLSGEALLDAIWAERKLELLGEGDIRWDMIRSGKFTERTLAVRKQMADMIAGLEADGYYTFENGRTISNYVWWKYVHLDNPLTFDCAPEDRDNPALYPGWRGQFDFTTIPLVAALVTTTDNNIAVKGLYEYIDPDGPEAAALEADGYERRDWGATIVANKTTIYDRNILSGLGTAGNAPRYYHPIPFSTISQSKGMVTNGYGLPQQ
ncbi:MAG: RagB/SusD family nutrient uptake outer membrane protein, partial [Mediterranea sp.]|nr:RagB/SusD family nutrient uptake outer membrane protein [Mediterranea sp.]